MKSNLQSFVLIAFLFTLLLSCSAEAQYDKISHDTRLLKLGASGVDDTASLNATVVLPVASEHFTGWIGLYTNQLAVDSEVKEQIFNAHVQGGTMIDEIGLKVFFTGERDKVAGIGLNTQIGMFADYEINEHLKAGAGNLFEREVANILGEGQDEDVTFTPRLLAYLAGTYKSWSALVKTTPQWKLEDFEATVELNYEYPVSERINAGVGLQFEYESAPIIEGKNIRRRYTSQVSVEF